MICKHYPREDRMKTLLKLIRIINIDCLVDNWEKLFIQDTLQFMKLLLASTILLRQAEKLGNCDVT